MLEIKVPDIGDFDEVTVIELLVKVSDTIKVDQSLLTVESNKASTEIPSSSAGVVKTIAVNLDEKVKTRIWRFKPFTCLFRVNFSIKNACSPTNTGANSS